MDILVVDDEPKICRLLEQILSARECTVRTAADGLEALARFQERPVPVVITDIRMPRMSGLELIRELKHLDPLVNIVVITAYPSLEMAVDAMKEGACDFITKPFDPLQIQAILYRCRQRLSLVKQLHHAGEGALKLEELNRRLAEVNDLKSQFLATISHEVNTPLCLMSEWIYLLADQTLGALTTDQQHALDVVLGAYDRLHRLLQQLIDLMHGHEIVLQLESTTVHTLLTPVVETLRARTQAQGLALAVTLPPEPLLVEIDPRRLTTALEALVDNAVKFNRPQGRVEVLVSALPTSVEVQIRDTGIGIPPGELERVWDAFYQVDRRLVREHGGAGIGLTLAKRYVELHGGTLTLSSEVGVGTTATLALPRPATIAAQPVPASSAT